MKRILIIDDSDAMRAQLELVLTGPDYTLVCAANGVEAIQTARSAGPFDLVITDMFMPEMDGIETIEHLQTLQPGIRIIAISGGGMGLSGTAMLEIADGLGARKTLPKPFEPAELLQAVHEALGA